MQPILSMSMWTSLSNGERDKIRALFSIPRSSHVVVSDGRIETDGTTVEDFKHLTIEKMQNYLGSTSADFHELFFMVVDRIRREPSVSVSPGAELSKETPLKIVPKKKGRPARVKKDENKKSA